MPQKRASTIPLVEELFEQMVSSFPVGIARLSKKHVITMANDTLRGMLGATIGDVVGMHCSEVFQLEDGVPFSANAREKGRCLSSCIAEIRLANGAKRVVRLSSMPKRNAAGRMDGELLVVVDITDWKREEIELEAAAHQIVYLRNLSMLLSDSDRPLEEVLHSVVHMIPEGWAHPDRVCSRIKIGELDMKSVNFEESKGFQSADVKASGSTVGSVEVRYVEDERFDRTENPFAAEETGMLQVIASELGRFVERKQIEEVRMRQHKELEIYSSLLRHDLRNDVGVLLGNVDLARALMGDRENDLQEVVASIEATCQRMMTLLSAFSRPKDDTHGSLPALIRQVCDRAGTVHSGLEITVDVEPQAEGCRIPESSLLPMVFENLLRNVAAHAGSGAHADVRIRRSISFVEVWISDDGPGIPAHIRGRLFEKGVLTRGGGLGLYLSREILHAMGGTIELSDLGALPGATFKVTIPVAFEQ